VTVEEYLVFQKERIDRFLDDFLLPKTVKPESIHRAIRYSVFSGGKRFRGSLTIAAHEVFGGESDTVLPVAAGIELIHTYSLIHDDLPCMDDDNLRRGKPTVHRVFGENIAVLAGDALNALAFELVARAGNCSLIGILAQAIGTEGMIGGQVADVESGGLAYISKEHVKFIHTRKTAMLIQASIEMGAVTAGASKEKIEIIRNFGSRIGLAFQIIDDILDIESSSEVLGKNIGSDEADDKATYPKVYGLEKSKKIARDIIEEAINLLTTLRENTVILDYLARFVESRAN